jgi:hypothetical protein
MVGLKALCILPGGQDEALLESHFHGSSEWRLTQQNSISAAQLDDKALPATAAVVSLPPESGAELSPLAGHIWGNARQRHRVRGIRPCLPARASRPEIAG